MLSVLLLFAHIIKIWTLGVMCLSDISFNMILLQMKEIGVYSNKYISRNSIIVYIVVVVAIYVTNISACYAIYKGLKIDNVAVGFKLYAGGQLSDGCFVAIMGIFIFFLYNVLQRFRKINKIVMYNMLLNLGFLN